MNGLLLVTAALIASGEPAQGETPDDAAVTAPQATALDDVEKLAEDIWSLSFMTYVYIVPDDHDYVQPTLQIDRGLLHLEGRYNYEDFDTGSVWIGCNFSWGEELSLELTPIAGVVFGDTEGVAPGYEFTLSWKGFSLYSEGEYVFDTDHSDDSFFYAWSELTWAPVEWFRFGWADQLTKTKHEEVIDENGPMAGLTIGNLDFTAYLLNIDDDRPTVVLGLTVYF